MAQTSGFFNSLIVEGQYDRKYNANDYSDNLAVVIGNGVLRSENDDLKVTASGLVPTVAVGRGWINGHYYLNSAPYSFPAVTVPTGGNRCDRVMLRLNNNVLARSVSLVYVEGEVATDPLKPNPTRDGDIFDLVLADVYVAANVTDLVVTDTRSDSEICGWVYSTSGDDSFFTSLDNSFEEWFEEAKNTLSSVTLFKKYSEEQTLDSESATVTFDIPQYDADTCFVEVYVNGLFDTDYTLSEDTITFAGTLNAGAVVTVNCYKSIDGTGIMTVADEITELQNQFATLDGISDFTYKCTGLNDNVSLSEIAQAFYNGSYTVGSLSTAAENFLSALGGNAFLAALPDDAQVTINVVGNLGATAAYQGSGTAESRYRWFSFGISTSSELKLVFDFANCRKINIACPISSKNIIFYGTDLNIRNANVAASGANANTEIEMCAGSSNDGLMNFENCRFKIATTGLAVIAENGNFRDCFLYVKSSGANAYCINAKSASFVRLDGGTYYAYTGTTGATSSVIYIASSETTAVVSGINNSMPTVEEAGYYQNYSIVANGGVAQVLAPTTTLAVAGNKYKRAYVIERSKR